MSSSIDNKNNEFALCVEHVTKVFPIKSGFFNTKGLYACNDISFSIEKGKGLAIVGESGCGKSTIARCILQIESISSGKVLLDGQDLGSLNKKDLRKARSKIQMVFQDPSDCLNPVFTVRQMLTEVIRFHRNFSFEESNEECKKYLKMVGMEEDCLDKYPHEFSGGQQQRLGIARALASGAQVFVLDEPTAALDTSIQGQILDLLIDLKNKYQFTYLFITHNLAVIQYLCEETAVMYLGKIVEKGKTETIMTSPIHPYTKALLSSIPIPDPNISMKINDRLKGETPSPIDLPKGCFLQGRCPYANPECTNCDMRLKEYPNNHFSSCIFSDRFINTEGN